MGVWVWNVTALVWKPPTAHSYQQLFSFRPLLAGQAGGHVLSQANQHVSERPSPSQQSGDQEQVVIFFFFFFFVARWSPPVHGGQIFIRRLVPCEGGEAGGRPWSSIAPQCDIDWNKRGHGLTRDRPHHSPHAPLHLDHVESRSVLVAVSLLCFTFSPQLVKHCAEETSVALTAQTALHPDYQSACGQMVSDELSANTYAHTQKCFSPNTPSLSLISHGQSSRVKKIVYSWGLECLQLRGRRTHVHREDLTVQPDVCGNHRIFVKSRGLIISTYHLFL